MNNLMNNLITRIFYFLVFKIMIQFLMMIRFKRLKNSRLWKVKLSVCYIGFGKKINAKQNKFMYNIISYRIKYKFYMISYTISSSISQLDRP